jgi:glycosyltransferase involved in cell wall biosynthesis
MEDSVPIPPGRPLRVAVLGSRGFPSTYGGFETFVRRLAPFLAARGHEVTVYGRGRESGPRAIDVDGVRVVRTWGIDSKSASTVTFGLTAALDALRQRPDVVLVLNVANGVVPALLKVRRIPTVVNVDGVEWERGKWGTVARATFLAGARLSARFADRLVADARHLVHVWQERFDVTPTFIPYGGDIVRNLGSERVAKLGLMPGEYALAVARLTPENNVELFVEAMGRLDWTIPTVVVGSANYNYELTTTLVRLHAEGRITWMGHVDDQDLLTELWANCGVYFHGHSVGGTNPALLQALGCGAPTIAVATEYNREVLGSDDHQLVDADADAIAAAIDALVHDRRRREALAARGQAIVGSRYRWDQVCLAYEAMLLDVGGHRGSSQRATAGSNP